MAKNRYYRGPPSDHFDGLRFFPPGGPRDKSLVDLARWMWASRRLPEWPARVEAGVPDRPPERVAGLRVSFVGHASFLIQCEGVNLLVDPVWSERAGPLGRFGPKRVVPPGVAFEDLPPLDAILVTHNHYDHLDLATLKRLARARPCPVLTPLGNDAIMRRADAAIDARRYDWGEVAKIGPIEAHLEPALHWSARGRGDRRMALWGSFVLSSGTARIYCAGDTGYGDGAVFRSIRDKHGPMTLALLPIGAYAPRWFMRDQHVDPHEAVAIFGDLAAERAFVYHWGTFRLTDEPFAEPVELLSEALRRAGVDPARFVVGPPGSVFERA